MKITCSIRDTIEWPRPDAQAVKEPPPVVFRPYQQLLKQVQDDGPDFSLSFRKFASGYRIFLCKL